MIARNTPNQFDFCLPDLGEGLESAELIEWCVHVGQRVNENETLAKMETAKALVEVPSPRAGVVAVLHGKPGDTIKVGAPLVTFWEEVAVQETPSAPRKRTSGHRNPRRPRNLRMRGVLLDRSATRGPRRRRKCLPRRRCEGSREIWAWILSTSLAQASVGGSPRAMSSPLPSAWEPSLPMSRPLPRPLRCLRRPPQSKIENQKSKIPRTPGFPSAASAGPLPSTCATASATPCISR